MDPGDGLPEEPEQEPLPGSIQEALLSVAGEVAGLTLRKTAAGHEFVVGSRVVATLDGRVAEFSLDPAVAAAAMRTPDTRPSSNAPDRIAFEPRTLDRYSADRAVAWLLSAIRRAMPTS